MQCLDTCQECKAVSLQYSKKQHCSFSRASKGEEQRRGDGPQQATDQGRLAEVQSPLDGQPHSRPCWDGTQDDLVSPSSIGQRRRWHIFYHHLHTVNTPISPPPVATLLLDHGPEVKQQEGAYLRIYNILLLPTYVRIVPMTLESASASFAI